MAMQTPPWALQAASHGAELFRRTTQSLLSGTGVVGSADLQVTANGTPNMSVNVAAGQVWIPGTLGGTSAISLNNVGSQTGYGLPVGMTTQGSYYALNDATVNLAISAANATNPRIDLVVASVQDSYYSGSTNTVVLQVVTGTPGASPSAPSAPANSVVLAQVSVAANATQITSGNITDERPVAKPYGRPDIHCRLHRAAAWTSVGSYTQTTVAFDTIDWNVGGGAVSSGVYTVETPGFYKVSINIGVLTNGTAGYQAFGGLILKNNSPTAEGTSWYNSSVSGTPYIITSVSDTLQCAVGDTIAAGYLCSTAGLTGAVNTEGFITIDWADPPK